MCLKTSQAQCITLFLDRRITTFFLTSITQTTAYDLFSALPEMDPYGFLGGVSEQLKAFQSFPVSEGIFNLDFSVILNAFPPSCEGRKKEEWQKMDSAA